MDCCPLCPCTPSKLSVSFVFQGKELQPDPFLLLPRQMEACLSLLALEQDHEAAAMVSATVHPT